MDWLFTSYLLLLLVSAVVTTLLAVYSWRHRTLPGAAPFVFTTVIVTGGSLTNALEMMSAGLDGKLFWGNLQYISHAGIPVAWLAMTLQFTGRDRWLTRRRLAYLCVIPAITLVLTSTNNLHGLMRYNVYLNTSTPIAVVGKSYGPWFWVHAAYSYVLLSSSVLLLAEMLVRTPTVYRGQVATLLVGMSMPMLGNSAYWLGFSPIPWLDVTFVSLGISGILVAWALFRFKLFDLVPVAHSKIIEGMTDGVIVLDARGTIVELNPRAQAILGPSLSKPLGQKMEEFIGKQPQLAALSSAARSTLTELSLDSQDGPLHCELHTSPLTDPKRGQIGRIIVLRDITEQKRAQAQLLQQQRNLAVLEERERLARELHDSLGQVLGYVNTQSQAVRELLARGNLDAADSCLSRLVSVAQDAHADVREFILGLKTTSSPQQKLFPSMEQYVQRFNHNYGIQAELNGLEALNEEELDPSVQVQLLRILQEALTNVRKHSGAHRVRITIVPELDHIRMAVEDNGQGFDPERLPGRDGLNFGLRIMRERAQEMAGSFWIESAPGKGTKVVVQAPLRKRTRGGINETPAGG